MPTCTKCGADTTQNIKFCASCGAAMLSNVDDGQQQTHAQTPPPASHNQQPALQAGENAVIGTLGWLGILILFAIPIVGFILCIVWAFGGGNLNRRNFSRACLILSVIVIVLSIVLVLVFVGPLALLAAIN